MRLLGGGDVGPDSQAGNMESKESRELVAPAIPKRMSDTILEYARPMIERLPDDHTFEELRATLVFAAVVWNVVLVPDIHKAVAYLSTKMPPRLRVSPPKGLAVIRRLLTRKDRHFSSDEHFVAAIDVHRVDGKAQVTAFGVCPEAWCCGPQARA